ncbi:ElaA protein [Jatrophihabitans endophyticus]|uniref:ElaA protein n=1 Tax=Jatrophihabitans endophyticus TaxID=1206085 RepID=A0A1M5GX82_9ACTN|nr:GNAT family N-acetyltransferase [Jatrophihabitans endophyticus]SHG08321.1 ElaA protein [Jatrophihabitans endophyticus]
MSPDPLPAVHDGLLRDLDPVVLYRILALRSEVFVLEQDCVYLDPDGRDAEDDARQLWIADEDGAVLATLRLLRDPDGTARIGRVATASAARGRGSAARLMTRALELVGDGETVLEAQSQLADWYGRFGFGRAGADYQEDGIPHTPMRRPSTR